MTNSEKQLFKGYRGAEQFVAIPLKYQEESTLNPQPNFLIIEKVFDYITVPIKNPDGSEVLVECQNTLMRLVYREILPEGLGKSEEIREIVLDDVGNIHLPYIYISRIRNQHALKDNEEFVNHWMSMFAFRGILEGYIVEYDREKSLAYLEEES